MLAVTFWENKNPSRALSGIGCVCPDGVSPDGWWCLSSCWCLGGLPIVFLWLLASWWHFGGVSVSLDGVQWCCESCSCFRGVFVVFWRCSGGVLVVLKKRYCFGVKWFPGQYQIGVNGDVKLCYWVVCWVNCLIVSLVQQFTDSVVSCSFDVASGAFGVFASRRPWRCSQDFWVTQSG